MSANQAKQQRRWATKMYKNRYQYTMDDMRSAGLNPILAYQQGAGGPPSGATGQVGDIGGAITGGIERGAGMRLKKGQRSLMRKQEEREGSQIGLNAQLGLAAAAQAGSAAAQQRLYTAQAVVAEGEGPAAMRKGAFDMTPRGGQLRDVNRILDTIGGGSGSSSARAIAGIGAFLLDMYDKREKNPAPGDRGLMHVFDKEKAR